MKDKKTKGKLIAICGKIASGKSYYANQIKENENIDIEWHYIDIEDEEWEKNINDRNSKIEHGLSKSDFYVTEGLKEKLIKNWEEPNKDEIDVWYHFQRR